MTLVTRQSMSDDSGTFTDGTAVNEAFIDQLYDQIDDQVHSTTNTSIKPKAIIDEVVTARGSKASLDARLDVALNEDGTPKAVAGQAALTDVQDALAHLSWVRNGDFLIWPFGDTSAPSGYTLVGAGASVARTGVGLGDITTKVGKFSVKLTRAAADCYLRQYLINSTSWANIGADYLDGRTLSFGCWVKASVGGVARLVIDDGATTTASSFHTGSGNWEWLTVSHTIAGASTLLAIRLSNETSSGDAYFSGATAVLADVAPSDFRPCPTVHFTDAIVLPGAMTAPTTDRVGTRRVHLRPYIIKNVVMTITTAPVGSSLIVDINQSTGSSAFTTKPSITAGANNSANFQPDGTYQYRCFDGAGGTFANALRTVDVDQVGSGTAGSDLIVNVHCMAYKPPQEHWLDFADNGA